MSSDDAGHTGTRHPKRPRLCSFLAFSSRRVFLSLPRAEGLAFRRQTLHFDRQLIQKTVLLRVVEYRGTLLW